MGGFWSSRAGQLNYKKPGTIKVYITLANFSIQPDPFRFVQHAFVKACPMLSDTGRFLELVRVAHACLYYLGKGRGIVFEISSIRNDISMVYYVMK
jgi:hypothetical protein